MLSREVAEKRLKEFQIKNWHKKRLDELGALPAKLCEVGRALLDRDATGKPFKSWQKRNEATEKAHDQLQRLSARDRQRIFSVLFPKLAAHLEAGWQLCARLPYEAGYERKGFRAPTDESVAKVARVGWLASLIQELDGYDPDALWCATWAAYLGHGYGADSLGVLLAAVIDAGRPR